MDAIVTKEQRVSEASQTSPVGAAGAPLWSAAATTPLWTQVAPADAAHALPQSRKGMAPEVSVRIEFGRQWISPETAGSLKPGSVLELVADVHDGVTVYADGRAIAKGAPVVVKGCLGVCLKEVV